MERLKDEFEISDLGTLRYIRLKRNVGSTIKCIESSVWVLY